MQKRPPGGRGGVVYVEMAGVEPASEERTIEITTYIVSLLRFAPPQPTDRSLAKSPRGSGLSHGFAPFLRVEKRAILPEFGASLESGRRDSWRRAA
jgi:hypothetical protein